MTEFSTGDTVRIDIPDETDPDHDQYHGDHGHKFLTVDRLD